MFKRDEWVYVIRNWGGIDLAQIADVADTWCGVHNGDIEYAPLCLVIPIDRIFKTKEDALTARIYKTYA